jgi:hypothetical protein
VLSREALRTWRDPVIALRALALVLAAALALGVVGACGDSGGSSSDDDFAEDNSSLTVTLDPDGPQGPLDEMTKKGLACGEESGDAVCQAMSEIDVAALGPVSPDTACTEIFGGPDTASLKGIIEGEEVDVELTRANGCEIERFDAALPLLQALYPDYEPGGSIAP